MASQRSNSMRLSIDTADFQIPHYDTSPPFTPSPTAPSWRPERASTQSAFSAETWAGPDTPKAESITLPILEDDDEDGDGDGNGHGQRLRPPRAMAERETWWCSEDNVCPVQGFCFCQVELTHQFNPHLATTAKSRRKLIPRPKQQDKTPRPLHTEPVFIKQDLPSTASSNVLRRAPRVSKRPSTGSRESSDTGTCTADLIGGDGHGYRDGGEEEGECEPALPDNSPTLPPSVLQSAPVVLNLDIPPYRRDTQSTTSSLHPNRSPSLRPPCCDAKARANTLCERPSGESFSPLLPAQLPKRSLPSYPHVDLLFAFFGP